MIVTHIVFIENMVSNFIVSALNIMTISSILQKRQDLIHIKLICVIYTIISKLIPLIIPEVKTL